RCNSLASKIVRLLSESLLSRPCTRSSAFLAQACQHLWLGAHHDVYREFTCVHHTMHPAPSPPDAGRYTVPSRFRCQSGDCGYHVHRLCTSRYLPAHLRRILLMGRDRTAARATSTFPQAPLRSATVGFPE